MSVQLAPSPVFQGIGFGGLPVISGTLGTFVAGTTTPQATYVDSTQTTPNANPVQLNANGQANVWLVFGQTYKLQLKDALGNQIWVVDQIPGGFPLTSQQIGMIINPQSPIEISHSITPINFQYPVGNVYRYGLIDDNSTNNGPFLAAVITLAQAGIDIYWPFRQTGIYLTSIPLLFTSPANLNADSGVRIGLTAAASYVVKYDYSGTGAFFNYGGSFKNFVLDGKGNAADGLYLRNVIDATFNARATNITNAGLHIAWAQLCNVTFICSNNVETMSTVPNNGVLIDNANGGGASSANRYYLTCEGLKSSTNGIGINAKWAINSTFVSGTSEGNQVGIKIGDATVGDNAGQGNIVGVMDVEANTVNDIQILGTNTYGNTIDGTSCSSTVGSIVNSSAANNFRGGFSGGITFDVNSQHNNVDGITMLGNSAVIVDNGVNNTIRDVWNVSSGVTTSDQPLRRVGSTTLTTTGAVSIDCSLVSYQAVNFTGSGSSTITLSAPTNTRDAMELKYCLRVAGAGTVTLAWNAVFKLPSGGVTVPANGFNRTYTYIFSAFMGGWVLANQTASDVAN